MGRVKDYNGFLDSPEDIADCLSCRRPVCMNCKEKSGIAAGTGLSRNAVKAFEAELIREYPSCSTEQQLIERMKSNRQRIARTRKRLSLPEPSSLSEEDRKKIATEASYRL